MLEQFPLTKKRIENGITVRQLGQMTGWCCKGIKDWFYNLGLKNMPQFDHFHDHGRVFNRIITPATIEWLTKRSEINAGRIYARLHDIELSLITGYKPPIPNESRVSSIPF